jgi:hypothetical protein
MLGTRMDGDRSCSCRCSSDGADLAIRHEITVRKHTRTQRLMSDDLDFLAISLLTVFGASRLRRGVCGNGAGKGLRFRAWPRDDLSSTSPATSPAHPTTSRTTPTPHTTPYHGLQTPSPLCCDDCSVLALARVAAPPAGASFARHGRRAVTSAQISGDPRDGRPLTHDDRHRSTRRRSRRWGGSSLSGAIHR